MFRKVPPKIYWPATSRQVEAQMRNDIMPSAFVRRMRTINMLSAATLMKIEDDFLLPFDVMDVHHVLDKLISQDAIIAQLDSNELSYALTTGNIRPLWEIAPANPLLLKGFTSGWINLFINEPFDPLCVMLAMRAKAMLDLVDEEGKSYNLIRKLGFGFIDFGEIEGEEPGDPGDYYPPEIDNPIDFPDVPPVTEPEPGDPGYVPPGPGDPGYVPPGPGDPGYVPGVGEDGYTEPTDVPPGTGGGGPGGGAPWGFGGGSGDLGGAVRVGGHTWPAYGDPCADVDDPEETVSFSYTTQGMGVDETQEFSVTRAHPRYSYENYEWKISGGGGSLTRDQEDPPDPIYGPEEEGYDPEVKMYGLDVTLTAPADNAECAKNPTIELWCGGELMASLTIAVNEYTGPIDAYKIDYECNVHCKQNDGSLGNCGIINCNGSASDFCTGCTRAFYGCDNVFRRRTLIYGTNSAFDAEGCAEIWGMYCQDGEETIDLRTGEDKALGCCPEELL